MSGAAAVAAFDVDNTLTTQDCVVPFLRRIAGTGGLLRAVARHPLALGSALARRDRDVVKEIVVCAVHLGRRVDEVRSVAADFAVDIERTRLRADVLQRLRWHQRQGHRTVLVSASLRSYLEPLADSLGIHDVLCTDVVADAGVYGDRLVNGNCRGGEKVARLRAWLDAEGLAGTPLWAYGDSKGDRPMLDLADHPVWVGGDTVLAVPTGFER